MESKAVPAWANQEDVATGAAPIGKARSMGREEWSRRYAASEFLRTVDANRFLVAEVASPPPGRALDPATSEGRNAGRSSSVPTTVSGWLSIVSYAGGACHEHA
ncbi:hypothetical protein GO613_15685 [Azoarcus communis]|uniref:hypothetical protein n=1 Tax=Parazoarcus communis TaxID=41977 RepID=UPI00145937C9|nr:hypothetical protein [Parazoarcus communis]NMG49538.1 hypothetical protein [Parazoarcus communis]